MGIKVLFGLAALLLVPACGSGTEAGSPLAALSSTVATTTTEAATTTTEAPVTTTEAPATTVEVATTEASAAETDSGPVPCDNDWGSYEAAMATCAEADKQGQQSAKNLFGSADTAAQLDFTLVCMTIQGDESKTTVYPTMQALAESLSLKVCPGDPALLVLEG